MAVLHPSDELAAAVSSAGLLSAVSAGDELSAAEAVLAAGVVEAAVLSAEEAAEVEEEWCRYCTA